MYRGLVAEDSALRLSADVPEEVLQRCIKTSKACHSFQVVRGVALRLFACFDAGKCKWNAVRCSLLDKAKEEDFRAKALRPRVYEELVFRGIKIV